MFYSKFYCQECNLRTRIMCFTEQTDLFINWRDTFTADGTDLCNISTGAEPPQEVTLDLLNIVKGKNLMKLLSKTDWLLQDQILFSAASQD